MILEHQTDTHEAVSDSTAYLLTSAMEDVVKYGTGRGMSLGGMTFAGKTGTTSDYNDVWFAGFTPYYTAAVWAGYDGNQKLAKGTYRTYHKQLWQKIMTRIHEGLPATDFTMPTSVEQATICAKSGLLAGSHCKKITEYFARSTIPFSQCTDCDGAWQREQERLAREAAARAAEEAAKKAEEAANGANGDGGNNGGAADGDNSGGTNGGNAPAATPAG